MQPRRHLRHVLLALAGDRADPVGGRRRPLVAHRREQRADAGADVADDGRGDLDVGVHLLRLDVDLDEFLRRAAPGLALAVREQPVEARPDQHDDVAVLQHGGARRAGAQRMRVGQEALAHAHRQERDAALLDEGADRIVGLRVGRALAENDERALGALEHIERALDRIGGRDLRGRRVDHLHERLPAGLRVHHLAEQLGRQIEIDAARPARHGRADGTRQADADVGRMQHAERRLAQRLGDGELIHLLVVALLQVDDLALGGAGDQDHREAVGGGVGERGQAVEEARRRHREADARLLRQEARDRRGVAGILLVAEGEHAYARGLRHAAEVRDRDAGHAVDRLDAVELERIDDEVETVRQLLLSAGCTCTNALHCRRHFAHSQMFFLLASIRAQLQSSSTKRSTWSRRRSVCSRTRRSARSVSRASSAATISL